MPYRLGESPMNVVSAQGFEPRTHALEGRCSIQLSYAPTLFCFFKIKLVRMKGVEPPRHRRQILSLVRLPIPPHPQLNFFGGGWWIRTTEIVDNRFTVCPLWPLGKSSVFSGAGDRNRTYNLLITSQLLYR